MLILRGTPTLSDFRAHKLLLSVQEKVPSVTGIYGEYQHFVALHSKLNKQKYSVLQRLLTYGSQKCRQNPSDHLFLITPRLGTLSPWSSKATEIAHNCDLAQVKRIERGVAYYLDVTKPLSVSERELVAGELHDRMTETVLYNMQDAERLFLEFEPEPLVEIDLQAGGKAALLAANQQLGLALVSDEIDYLFDNYQKMQRNPTDVELMMFAQANSEHCRHKIFNASWSIDGVKQEHSLFQMIRTTHQMNNKGVLSAYKDNASVINGFKAQRFYPEPQSQAYQYSAEDVHILMKVETHNHPTAISPWQGASTGAGGEIRDEGATGKGAKPKAGLTGFSVSNLNIPGFQQSWEHPYGKPDRLVSALDIMTEGPLGSASFNNEFGRPGLCGYFRTLETAVNTEQGLQVYGYHKPIMLAGGLGNIRDDHVEKDPIPVNASLVVLGGPAMQIGLGGGSASSIASGDGQEELDFSSVQRGNPEMERRCQEVIDRCWQLGNKNPISFIHDVGAGGLSNALPELVNDGGRGGHFQLRAIDNDEPGMSPLALWCNESQERYVLAIAPNRLAQFEAICQRERCPYAIVGKATEEKQLQVEDSYFNNTPVAMPLATLLGKPPRMHQDVTRSAIHVAPLMLGDVTVLDTVQNVLKLPVVASKSFLITIGDRTVTGLVAQDQMVGPWQVPVADCAVTATSFNTYTGEAMAIGERAPIALVNAPASGRMAVAEAITNIASSRITNIGDIKLSANWMAAAGAPGEDVRLFDTVQAVAMELCAELGICIPVGKDSMSMKTSWHDDRKSKSVTSPLSLIVSAFAPVIDIRKTVTPQLRTDQGDTDLIVIDLGRGKNRLGGSALAQVYCQVGNEAPDLDNPKDLKGFFAAVQTLIANDYLIAYHDRSDGGLFTTLIEMTFAGRTGITVNLNKLITTESQVLSTLFNEELGAVIQVHRDNKGKVKDILAQNGLGECSHTIGTLRGGQSICFTFNGEPVLHESRVKFQRWWAETSYRIQAMRDNEACAQQEFDNLLDDHDQGLHAAVPFDVRKDIAAPYIATGVRPAIAILREQGVNGHTEMAAAFECSGFSAIDVHMSDLITGRRQLKDYQGLAACGGFSYGDVLGAGEGWAKSILCNESLRDQFAYFFDRQDSFTLGVCNGCQMLSNLHELIPGTEHWPHFVRNQSEQFESRLVMVEVQPSQSLLLSNMVGARMPIAVAHGEGLAEFSKEGQLAALAEKRQIALKYIDNTGRPTQRYPYNPNGTTQGITGLTSEDGRVTIMMPHPERLFRTVQHSWHPDSWAEHGPWIQMFRNARAWLK
ncbi:MAG: phosphoribosylformylglycinamidine synthase [Endozoicomonas sp. (ex Botrylloides leachii)]|nr:phosphoribosylformylglycinamidine synthase [Endozoicomonas sp. (ex Botrylloides leachii)]